MQATSRRATALTSSLVVHAVAIIAVMVLLRPFDTRQTARVDANPPPRMVWIPDPRPAAAGGGGPAKMPKPIQREQPRAVAPPVQPTPAAEPPIIEPPQESVVATDPTPSPAVATADLDGPLRSGAGETDRLGSRTGSQGGPGRNGNEPYGVGNDVTAPIPLRRPPPAYTAEAMRARLQGVVVLDCVVQPNGICSDIRVTRSLDTRFGLDQQAIASAREWRFRPGLRAGEPVPVRVTLEIAFTIR